MKTLIIFFLLPQLAFGFQAVDINQASSEQIALLPGIGKTVADAILRQRQIKLFTSADELLSIPGMSAKKYAAIEDKILIVSKKPVAKKNSVLPQPATFSIPKAPVIDLASLERKIFHHLDVAYASDKNLSQRARASAWLPKLSLEGDVDRHDAATEKALPSRKDSAINRSGTTFGIGINATFELGDLIFHKSELEIAKIGLKKLEAREKIREEVHKNYFLYQQLNEERPASKSEHSFREQEARLGEIAAYLDSLSDGLFSSFQRSENP